MNEIIRPDLLMAKVFYYPIIEESRYKNLEEMYLANEWTPDMFAVHIAQAAVEQSLIVVCDSMTKGDPAHRIHPVLMFDSEGGVMLCMGLFSEISETREYVDAAIKYYSEMPEYKGKVVGIGEFRANKKTLLN